ncbi:metallophosphoesterase [Listeria ilorinensis]|uniref:metallophosphoesterase n=1 Tax=Listeria ilorinensis TaxID=2867439 RepID=UPI001EF6904A|nr:metallophosphoesterase [Listeria ilorinensis]
MGKWKLLLSGVLTATLLAGCSTGQAEEKKITPAIPKEQDLKIAVSTDIHYLAPELTDGGAAFQKYVANGDGKQLAYSDQITDAFLKQIEKQQADILILSGDLTNNGEKASHEELAKKLTAVEKAGTDVYVIPGNHDINNPWARSFSGEEQHVTDDITPEDFEKIYQEFGYQEAISRDAYSLSYLAPASQNIWLLMLDTSIYDSNKQLGSPATEGGLTTGTLEWIQEMDKLADEHGAKIIPVMHHNLTDHSSVIQDGYTINYADKVVETFADCGFEFSLSGHIHTQNIATATAKDGTDITDIVTNALSVYPHKYGMINYNHDNGQFDYASKSLDLEAWAREHQVTDPNLLQFSAFDYETFYQNGYNKAMEDLTTNNTLKNYSEEDKQKMADTMAIDNMSFFAGDAPPDTAGDTLWQEAPDSFLRDYIVSTQLPLKQDNNYWTSK